MTYSKKGSWNEDVMLKDEPDGGVSAEVQNRYMRLLRDCRLNVIESCFKSQYSLLEATESDEEEWEVRLHLFLDDASGEEKLRRLKEMEEKGEIRMFKGMRRAMEYITNHPDIQLNLSLVVPVCARDSDGDEGLPIFFSVRDGCVKRRYLMPRKCKRTFPARYMWFVLRKRERV